MQHLFFVSGMTCGHCEKAVSKAVQAMDADATVRIDRPASRVEISSDLTWDAWADAIVQEGYAVTA